MQSNKNSPSTTCARAGSFLTLYLPERLAINRRRAKFKVTKEVTVAKLLGLTCERQRRTVGTTVVVEPAVAPAPRTATLTIEVQGTTAAIGAPQSGTQQLEPGDTEGVEPTERLLPLLLKKRLTDASIGLDRFGDEAGALYFARDDCFRPFESCQEVCFFGHASEVHFLEGKRSLVLFLVTLETVTFGRAFPDRPAATHERGRVECCGKDQRAGGRFDDNFHRLGKSGDLIPIDMGGDPSVELGRRQIENELGFVFVPSASFPSVEEKGCELAMLFFSGLSHCVVWVTKSFKVVRSKIGSWKMTYHSECFSPQHFTSYKIRFKMLKRIRKLFQGTLCYILYTTNAIYVNMRVLG